jgi:hypothetical protein
MSAIDPLDEDPFLPNPSCQFALVTFITVPGEKKAAMKIRGCFRGKEDADRHMQKLNAAMDPQLQTPTFLVECGKWLCVPPPRPDEVADSGGEEVYQEEFLQGLVDGHRKSRSEAQAFFKERQAEIKERGLLQDPEPVDGNSDPMPPTLDPQTGQPTYLSQAKEEEPQA